MVAMIAGLVQALFGLAIFFGVLYALGKTITRPIHEKLDRLLAAQNDLSKRIAALERETSGHI